VDLAGFGGGTSSIIFHGVAEAGGRDNAVTGGEPVAKRVGHQIGKSAGGATREGRTATQRRRRMEESHARVLAWPRRGRGAEVEASGG
jgi:hypothetical protein